MFSSWILVHEIANASDVCPLGYVTSNWRIVFLIYEDLHRRVMYFIVTVYEGDAELS